MTLVSTGTTVYHMDTKVNTHVRIRKELSRALRQAAEDENRSLGAQLEVVIEDWLDWREDKPARRRPPSVGRVSP